MDVVWLHLFKHKHTHVYRKDRLEWEKWRHHVCTRTTHLCLPIVPETLLVNLCFLNWSVLTPWVYGVNVCGRRPVRFGGAVPWSPELTGLRLSFMLALCISLCFDCCWVFLWWVLPSSWLTEGHSMHHILYSVVQVWTGFVEAGSSVCTRFWGFSLTIVQLFVLGNFSTI